MDRADEPPGAGGIDPPAAFFGLWPKFVDRAAADRSRGFPLSWRTVAAPEPPRLRIA